MKHVRCESTWLRRANPIRSGSRLSDRIAGTTAARYRHMLNWAVGREYLDRTPFRRGTEVLVRMELEDNRRRRRISESEEAALLAVASPHLRSMIFSSAEVSRWGFSPACASVMTAKPSQSSSSVRKDD